MSDLSLEEYWNPSDIDEAIVSFEAIQEELNYQSAQTSLKNLVNRIDLTPQEQAGLEGEIDRLSAMLAKLEQSVVQIAAFGMVGRGKSSVLNALLGQNVFETGPLHGVTQVVNTAQWHLSPDERFQGTVRLSLAGWGNSQIQLIDTPGIDEVDGETREILARDMARQVDLILLIIAGDMAKVEFEALSQLREAGKPIILVFNKIDQYPEADRLAIYQKIRDDRVKQLLSPDEIVMVAASPLKIEAVRDGTGKLKTQKTKANPQIVPLKLKILEILQREGKSLVALNTMLYADEVNEQIVERKMTIREAAANRIIHKAVVTKAIAVALNPVTVIDLLTGAIIDVAAILALSRLYGIAMTQPGAIALLQKIGISMGGISASEFVAAFGLSSLKGLLGLAAPATGGVSLLPYASVALAQAGVAGVSCYAIGQVTKQYLVLGASWGPDGPKSVVKSILMSLDRASILSRIKWEVGAKLGKRQEAKGKRQE